MKPGKTVTKDDLNNRFKHMYLLINGIVPYISMNITSGQVFFEDSSGTDPSIGQQMLSKFGTQFFSKDIGDIITGDIIDRINRVLGE